MRKAFLVLCFLAVTAMLAAQADVIVGKWYTEGAKSIVEISKVGNKYFGKITWLKDPTEADGSNKLDTKNENKALRTQQILGLEIIKDFVFIKDKLWEKGTIYNPDDGKTYSCSITLQKDGTLFVRGFIMISLLGKTQVWTKVW
jgi:uncharacterized protein (DUF2147 family)